MLLLSGLFIAILLSILVRDVYYITTSADGIQNGERLGTNSISSKSSAATEMSSVSSIAEVSTGSITTRYVIGTTKPPNMLLPTTTAFKADNANAMDQPKADTIPTTTSTSETSTTVLTSTANNKISTTITSETISTSTSTSSPANKFSTISTSEIPSTENRISTSEATRTSTHSTNTVNNELSLTSTSETSNTDIPISTSEATSVSTPSTTVNNQISTTSTSEGTSTTTASSTIVSETLSTESPSTSETTSTTTSCTTGTTETPSAEDPSTSETTSTTKASTNITSEAPSVESPSTSAATSTTTPSTTSTSETPRAEGPGTSETTSTTTPSITSTNKTPSAEGPSTSETTSATKASTTITSEAPSVESTSTSEATSTTTPSTTSTSETPRAEGPSTSETTSTTTPSISSTNETPSAEDPSTSETTSTTKPSTTTPSETPNTEILISPSTSLSLSTDQRSTTSPRSSTSSSASPSSSTSSTKETPDPDSETSAASYTTTTERSEYIAGSIGYPVCYILTNATECPYLNWDPTYINFFADLFGAKTVWAPFKRNCTKNNLGPFEPTEHIPYQTEWNPTYDVNISNKNVYDVCCLVRRKGKYEPASCNETHPRICVYNTRSINCRINCDQNDDCFCTHREKLCKSDNQKLAGENFFPIESSCFFGNINRNVTMLFDERGFKWKLSDGRHCSICQKKKQNGNISIRLRYVQNRDEIKLTITNSTKLLAVSCMTDAGADLVRIIYQVEYGNNTSSCNGSETITTIEDTFSPFNRYPSHYWCMAFGRAHKIIKSNIIFVVPSANSATGNDYAVIAEVEGYQNIDPYAQKDFGIEEKIRQNLNHILDMIRPMQLLNYTQDKGTLGVVIHLTLKLNNNVTLLNEYNEVNTALNGIKGVVNVRNSEVCLPDTTQSNNFTLRWPETRIGVTIRPHSDYLCLHKKTLSHYIPVRRKCEGNFLHGAYWGEVEGNCYVDFVPSKVTNELHDLIKDSSGAPEKVTEKLFNITEKSKNVMSYDIDMMSEILERVSGNIQVVNIVSNIMNYDREVLKEAQELLNSTDKILYVLDNLANDIDANNFTRSSKNLLVKVDDYNLENVIGIGIQENDKFQDSKIKPLYESSNVLEHDFSVAAFVESEHKEIQLSFTIFRDDILFNNEKKVNKSVEGRIISIIINDTAFVGKVFVLFKNSYNTDSERNCGYWKYGSKSLVDNIKGRWSLDEIQQQANGTYTICEFDHLTHYGVLVNDKKPDELGLDIATMVGACLSFVGILGICLNAIVDYKWRNIPSSMVIVCFSITIGLQLILLYLADILKDYEVCVPIGIALHYTVLSEFCWMLVIAILQYKRYVQVFYNHINHLVAKSAIFSWGVPLPIVATTYVIDPTTHKENPNLCYPSGIMLISFVISPVTVVLLINCIIFTFIIKSICIRKTKPCGGKDNESYLQVLLAILLFFLLGISWVLGAAVALDGTMIFVMYLFTLTTSFQGFVIFMYFVLLNEKAKLRRYLISWSNKVLRRKTKVQSALFNTNEAEHSTKPYHGKQH